MSTQAAFKRGIRRYNEMVLDLVNQARAGTLDVRYMDDMLASMMLILREHTRPDANPEIEQMIAGVAAVLRMRLSEIAAESAAGATRH